MENKKDFTEYEIVVRGYNGANGNKIAVNVDGEIYMLKFPPKPTINKLISYTNSSYIRILND